MIKIMIKMIKIMILIWNYKSREDTSQKRKKSIDSLEQKKREKIQLK